MDLSYPAEAEQYRKEVRTWLEEHLPAGWFDEGFEMTSEQRAAFNADWPKELYGGGWICATWPKEYGGKGLTTMEGVVVAEEFARAKAPMRADFFGDTLVGPTILQWGTEEQKKEFLPKILRGEMKWCQGFSEPNSGSDLASLKTTAVRDGDEWVINGQKVWTTQAQFADYVFPLPGGQRRRRDQQRLGRGQHHAGPRAGHVGHHQLPALRGRVRPHGGGRPGQRPDRGRGRPPAPDALLQQDPDPAGQRPVVALE